MSEYTQLTGRILLLALSLKYDNDWFSIWNDIKNKVAIDNELLEKARNYDKPYTTIVDSDYPEHLKTDMFPPFVIF